MSKAKNTIVMSIGICLIAIAGASFMVYHSWVAQHGASPRPPKPHLQATVDPQVFEAYVGRFALDGQDEIMTITREGEHLYEQITDRPRREIFPESAVKYFFKDIDAEITFVADTAGKFDTLELAQFDEIYKGKRLQ